MTIEDFKLHYAKFGFSLFSSRAIHSKSLSIQRLISFIENDINKKLLSPGFEGENGASKQYIDIFVRYKKDILGLIPVAKIKDAADYYYGNRPFGVITHSKISLKSPNSKSQWFPHQDNSYKPNMGESARNGFALMLMLEKTDNLNGCLHVFQGSHTQGLFSHDKIIENHLTGSYQLALKKIPRGFRDVAIVGRPGDIVMFDNNTIHYSGNSYTNSKRLAIIFEINHLDKIVLDDYGRVPQILYGKISALDKIRLLALSAFSRKRIAYFIQKNLYLKKIANRILKKHK